MTNTDRRVLFWALVMFFVGCALVVLPHFALAKDDGRYAQVDERTREWFRMQRVPNTPPGMTAYCCSIADGVHAEEEIRNGQYWVRYVTNEGVEVDWTPVPDEVHIKEPNTYGRTVVWYMYANGKPQIRCFIPGAGI